MKQIVFRKFIGAVILLVALGAVGTEFFLRCTWSSQSHSIAFSRGIKMVTGGDSVLRKIADQMKQDISLKAVITGHTGTLGDPLANRQLSLQRAQSVVGKLVAMGVGQDRLEAVGEGGLAPLDKLSGESERAWQNRLARVEITLGRDQLGGMISGGSGN